MMEEPVDNTPEPTLVDLAEQLDMEGMVGFTQTFHQDLHDGFEAITVERFPAEDPKGTGQVICLGMGGSAAGGEFGCLDRPEGKCPVVVHRDLRSQPVLMELASVATSHSGNTERP